jgi:hypothetical protein
MKKYTEENLQNQCYVWFNNTYCLKHHKPRLIMFVVPNETAMKLAGILKAIGIPSRTVSDIVARIMKTLKSIGLLEGVSDNIIVAQDKVYFIEFKLPNNNQQDNQKDFESRVSELGHTYIVIKSVEQFKEFCELCFKKQKTD